MTKVMHAQEIEFTPAKLKIFTNLEDFLAFSKNNPKIGYVILCREGIIDFDYNGQRLHMHQDEAMLSVFSYFPENIYASKLFKCDIVICELDYLDEILFHCLRAVDNWTNKVHFLHRHPVVHLSSQQIEVLDSYKVIANYYVEGNEKLNERIGFLHLQAIILTIISWVDNYVQMHFSEDYVPETKGSNARMNDIVLQFQQLLMSNFGTEKQVNWYAAKMNITPTYLYMCCKQVSDTSPQIIINDLVLREAKWLLQSTTISVKEISDRLTFATASNFSKFFKKHTGLTPLAYRRNSRA